MVLPAEAETKELKHTFWSEPPTEFDPQYGYRWRNVANRMVRFSRGECIADNQHHYNNYHQHASYDFTPKKPANTIRMVVFGDSFTNDIMLRTAWPETLQHLLNSHPEHGVNFEVYAFPTDGGGLVQWHNTFTRLVHPEFEYDAVLVADWHDDLGRKWISGHSTRSDALLHFSPDFGRPKDAEEVIGQGRKSGSVLDGSQVDELKARQLARVPPKPTDPISYCSTDFDPEVVPADFHVSVEDFVRIYGQPRLDMLTEMVNSCRAGGRQFYYAVLPTRRGLIERAVHGRFLRHQAVGAFVGSHFTVPFFDGFTAFDSITAQELCDFYWLKYDGHWNLGASTHFALRIGAWLMRPGMLLPIEWS